MSGCGSGTTRAGIRQIELILSSRCNLACSYCYQNDKKAGRLDWEAARSALDLALDDHPDELAIHFFGGEPLLEFGLIRRSVEHVRARCRPGKRVRFHLGTNGLLLGEEQAEFLAANEFELHLSFDGVPAAQRLRGPGTYERLDSLLDRLRSTRPRYFRGHLTISMTFLPSTVALLPQGVRYFLGKGVQSIDLSPQSTDTSWWDPARIVELEEAFARIFEECLDHHDRTGEVPLRIFRRRAEERQEPPTRRAMCGVGSGENLTIDSDGQVYGCVKFARSYQRFTPFLEKRLDAMRLGAVDDPELPAKLERYPRATRRAEIFDHKERKRSSYGRCRECRYLASCFVCPVTIGNQAGNEDPDRVPDFLCAYNLVFHRFRERFPAMDDPWAPSHADEPGFLRRIRAAAEERRASRSEMR